MKIELKEIPIRDLVEGYEDNEEEGVVAYSGDLDVRPPYQREFVYKDKQRNAVIDTVTRGFPLNVMYWAALKDDKYEIIDGQQRTISICQFVDGEFSFNDRYFHNLQADEKEQILDYKLSIYQCDGTDSEKLSWFETINIAGAKLTQQELRNAVYAGSWVTDAKRYFSKRNSAADGLGGRYMRGEYIRQEYLETVIKWINGGDIEGYMATHQHDPTAVTLWNYFQSVVGWVDATFPEYRGQMRGVAWGDLYNQFKDDKLDPAKLEKRVSALMADDDVTRKSGIYTYVLSGEEKHLSIRQFTEALKVTSYGRQKGICANRTKCLTPGNADGKKKFELSEMEADHITPWSKGGRTDAANCQMLCLPCNRQKGGL